MNGSSVYTFFCIKFIIMDDSFFKINFKKFTLILFYVKGALDLAENGDGRWKIEIQAIQCPVGNGKIEYKFQGSNPWYLKLQIRNARYEIETDRIMIIGHVSWSLVTGSYQLFPLFYIVTHVTNSCFGGVF